MPSKNPTVSTLTAFAKAINEAGASLGRDLSIRQLHTLIVTAAAGERGIDVTQLAQATGSSSAAISRNVRVLGAHHYDRAKGDGLGLLAIELDPMDNRRRIAKPTPKGLEVMASILSHMT